MRPVLVLMLLVGCDQAFDIPHVEAPRKLVDGGVTDVGPDAFTPSVNCPSSYVLELRPGGSRYRELQTAAVYMTQFTQCAVDKPGLTHLAVIESVDEANVLFAWLQTKPAFTSYYVGALQSPDATDPNPALDWLWATGEQVLLSSWAAFEPNDGDSNEDHGEDAASIERARVGIVDVPSTYQLWGLCECDGRPVDPVAAGYVR